MFVIEWHFIHWFWILCVCVCVCVCIYICVCVSINGFYSWITNMVMKIYENDVILLLKLVVVVCWNLYYWYCCSISIYWKKIYKNISNISAFKTSVYWVFNLFTTHCLRWVGWAVSSTPRPYLPQEKTQYPLYRRLVGPQGWSGQAENLAPLGFDPRTVQPVVIVWGDIMKSIWWKHQHCMRKITWL